MIKPIVCSCNVPGPRAGREPLPAPLRQLAPRARLAAALLRAWYVDHQHHSGLALFTLGDVFHGRVAQVAAARQAALDAGFAAHPERFPNGAPVVALPPARVAINPLAAPVFLPQLGSNQQEPAS